MFEFLQTRQTRQTRSTGRTQRTKQLPEETPSARDAPAPQPATKLHSITGLQSERSFTGQFNARGTPYDFTFAPTAAAIVNRRLELTGRFDVRATAAQAARGASPVAANRTLNGVRATLAATQGGVGITPTRRASGVMQNANVSTPEQKQEQEKAPETQQQPPVRTTQPAAPGVTESTDDLSFVGVMYFRLQPLDARALGIPLDLSRVQLNARLTPTSDTERELLFIYTDIVAALYKPEPDERAADEHVKALNGALKA